VFDFSWTEIMVVGIVALLAIGPKDMPVAIRAVARVLKKLRGMAGEFQAHVDDMMRDADLQDVQSSFRDLRGMNLGSALETLAYPDGESAPRCEPRSREPRPELPGTQSPARSAGSAGVLSEPGPFDSHPAFLPPISALNRHVKPTSV